MTQTITIHTPMARFVIVTIAATILGTACVCMFFLWSFAMKKLEVVEASTCLEKTSSIECVRKMERDTQ